MTRSAKMRNVLAGAGSIMSVSPKGYFTCSKRLYHPAETVSEALAGDWKKLGKDMRRAAKKVMNGK